MKTLRVLLLILLLAAVLTVAVYAAPSMTMRLLEADGAYRDHTVAVVSLTLDGQPVQTDVPAFAENGRTLVPVRVISENLGASVTWKQESSQVQIENGQTAITLTLGSAEAVVNGETVRLPSGVPATVVSYEGANRTMVPMRFISEQLGATVEYLADSATVAVTAPREARYQVAAPQVAGDTVTVAAEAGAESHVFSLPGRVVADFPGGVFSGGSIGRLDVAGTVISAVRYNQYDTGYGMSRVARVVLDLQEGCTIDDVSIDFTDGLLTVVQPAAAPLPPKDPGEAPPEEESPTVPLIVLDAGHGGTDVGAPAPGIWEKELTLPTTLATGAILEAAGYRVEYTRRGDDTVTLAARAEQANTQGATLFVSIHANAFPNNPAIHGLETYYGRDDPDSRPLAEAIHRAVRAATGADDRGIRTAGFYVLQHTVMPAVLVETGYLTNEDEFANLATEEYRNLLAQGIAEGIMAYLPLPDAE